MERHPPDEKTPKKPTKRSPHADSDPYTSALDKKPEERTPHEIKEAIEYDALLERRGEHSR